MNGQAPANGNGNNGLDSNVIFNNQVTGATNSTITANSTITITNGANGQAPTRPQSVWYTVSASGTIASSPSTPTTQQSYTPTTDETNNIFAITSGKIAGATGNGTGGIGSSSGDSQSTNVYTTAVGGTKSNTTNGSTNTGTAVASPSPGSLVTNNTNGAGGVGAREGDTTITINQNYLPLGITSAVKDAYFNHNGII